MENLKDNLTKPSPYEIILDVESDILSSVHHAEQAVLNYLKVVSNTKDDLLETLQSLSNDRKSIQNLIVALKEEISKWLIK